MFTQVANAMLTETAAGGQMAQMILPLVILIGVGIGFLGSFFTVRKHLRV